MTGRAALLALASSALAAGCARSSRSEPARPDADAAAVATGAAQASANRTATPTPTATSAPSPCRAITADGDVRASGVPVALGSELPRAGWIALSPGARLVAKDPRTARETTFLGPAEVCACVAGKEESWVAAGRFESAVGAGEAPGAEEWVVVPQAVVRYAAAKLHVSVRPDGASVRLDGGVAFVWPADDARVRGAREVAEEGEWRRVVPGTAPAELVAARADGGAADGGAADRARSAVEACSQRASRARELARAVLSGRADGAVVVDQVVARRLARAACAVASLRVSRLAASDAAAALSVRVADADAAWSALPVGAPRPD